MISLSSGTEEEVWYAREPEFKTEIVHEFFPFQYTTQYKLQKKFTEIFKIWDNGDGS
jgi:hypothetical protein